MQVFEDFPLEIHIAISTLDKQVREIFPELALAVAESSFPTDEFTLVPCVLESENEPLLIVLSGGFESIFRQGPTGIPGLIKNEGRRNAFYAFCRENGIALETVPEVGLQLINKSNN